MASVMSNYELYGGAITVNLPTNLIDASDLRQIPDAQEVYLDSNTDTSFIFEILDRVEPEDPGDAVCFHFGSVAHDSSAQSSRVDRIEVPDGQLVSPPHTPKPILLEGIQQIAKFNTTKLDTVNIFMALYRLSEIPHDIVFVLNVPEMDTSDDSVGKKMREMFESISSSLTIKDFALFGAESEGSNEV